LIYANHAGTSWPKPDAVRAAVAETLAASPLEAEARFEAARAEVCEFLGIGDPERFLFTSGCTSALAVALADLPWSPGDTILTSSLEHHALAGPVERLAARAVRHVAAPYRPGRPVDLDFVRDALRRGAVRLVAVSGASNVTGELLPVAPLAELAHEHGAICLVDAAQTVGVVPVDVGRLGVDILVLAGHKGPLGPQGVGGLWAAPHVEFASPAAACGIGAGECRAAPGYCDVGSVNLAGAAGLAAGLRWIAERGIDASGGRARRLAADAVDALREVPGCTILGGVAAERSAAFSLRIAGLTPQRVEALLLRRGILVRAGAHCAPLALVALGEPGGTLRVSFGATSDDGDAAAVVDALREITAEEAPDAGARS
jgi:selenocysteine lyase/cysteine desulfurase